MELKIRLKIVKSKLIEFRLIKNLPSHSLPQPIRLVGIVDFLLIHRPRMDTEEAEEEDSKDSVVLSTPTARPLHVTSGSPL